jgi:hypothetical protein
MLFSVLTGSHTDAREKGAIEVREIGKARALRHLKHREVGGGEK